MPLDCLADLSVLLINGINLAVKHVHIVVERVVLLLCFDEGSHDLFDVANS